MIRKIFRILLFVFLIYLPISFVVDQFSTHDKLSVIAEKFEKTVDDHEVRGAKFHGELDSIVTERNQILRQEKFLIFGSWHSNALLRTNMILYLNASFLPSDIYNMMTKIQFTHTANYVEVIFGIIIFFLPIILYVFGWISVKYYLRKPAH